MTRTSDRDTGAGGNADVLPAWQEPRLRYVGDVGDVVRQGGGKLSPAGGDPGEMRIQKPAQP